ncbi:unnamed protein product [Notodromas monacha]|uniref:Uncharacterized protein n=1 Tax=Notodromas monacha TaxID=399045 RepID=A0A7R9BMM8_9CRUS|nr:unnamed protein product [Notodromas monacha]CAG0918312.1 unnamed protein product [Notodromas monacha]
MLPAGSPGVRRQYRRLFCPGSRDRSSASHGEDESMCCLRWCCKKRSSPGSCSAELSCDKDSEPRCIAGFGNAYSGVEFRLHQPNANNSAGMNNKQYQHAHGRDEPCSRGCRPSTESRSTRSSGFTSCSVSSGVGAPPTAVFNKSQNENLQSSGEGNARQSTGIPQFPDRDLSTGFVEEALDRGSLCSPTKAGKHANPLARGTSPLARQLIPCSSRQTRRQLMTWAGSAASNSRRFPRNSTMRGRLPDKIRYCQLLSVSLCQTNCSETMLVYDSG